MGRPGGKTCPPRSPASRGPLPPEGARFSLGRPGGKTWRPSRTSRSHWGFASALRTPCRTAS
ncbi:MAG: hypothetical protein DI563_24210 [Variovorax paradoxus]|uniref:Uncharacterized protein n=1 Tax=Variovorax paradoxus TaxID=34073 RepID=A0A2W5PUD2_VARPD|nr:MAG: hypothetical protein DI563_24210 [Variovorax paradoxus]